MTIKLKNGIHAKDFESSIGSGLCDTEDLSTDFVSFPTGSEFCEIESLPKLAFVAFSVGTDIFRLELDLCTE